MQMLKQNLIEHEGLKLKPYTCPAGKLTIGVGRNIEDNGITYSEAMVLLENDILRCNDELKYFEWYENCNNCRKDVLIELCFNIGLTKLLKFEKMIDALERRDYITASLEMLDSLWAKQVGEKRSNKMAQLMRRGTYADPPPNCS